MGYIQTRCGYGLYRNCAGTDHSNDLEKNGEQRADPYHRKSNSHNTGSNRWISWTGRWNVSDDGLVTDGDWNCSWVGWNRNFIDVDSDLQGVKVKTVDWVGESRYDFSYPVF